MNWADILILCILGAAIFFAVRAVYRAKKRGGCVGCSSCSGSSPHSGCSGCAGSGGCNGCSCCTPPADPEADPPSDGKK